MILDIIKAISGKIKFCLETGTDKFYFIEKAVVDNRNGSTVFIDAVDGSKFTLSDGDINLCSIMTYNTNTIPSQQVISDIEKNESDFFTIFEDDHNVSNNKFNELLQQCKDFVEYFGTKNINNIKKCVLRYNTSDLEKLKILGCKEAYIFSQVSTSESVYISQLYWKLVRSKLNEAIAEIDKSIEDMDDDEFISEAEIIKNDLRQNVAQYTAHMQGVTFEKLFNQWPTLLNPSPFNKDGN